MLPVLLPSRFRSRISKKHIDTHTVYLKRGEIHNGKLVEVDLQLQPTCFLLAVQETNFLYSFTLSGFVAVSTACTLLIDMEFSGPNGFMSIIMLVTSTLYAIYGVFISVYLYGRKTDYLHEFWLQEEQNESSVSDM